MLPIASSSADLPEFETRRQKIDVLLKEQGWNVGDRSKVILEVDTKQSDFRAQNYKTVAETLKNDLESKYADYLLLDAMNAPIAVVEAKRTSKDPILGRKQAEEYADDIKSQTGKDVFIFLSMDMRYGSGTERAMDPGRSRASSPGRTWSGFGFRLRWDWS